MIKRRRGMRDKVLALKAQHPTWTVKQLAEATDTQPCYIRLTLKRATPPPPPPPKPSSFSSRKSDDLLIEALNLRANGATPKQLSTLLGCWTSDEWEHKLAAIDVDYHQSNVALIENS